MICLGFTRTHIVSFQFPTGRSRQISHIDSCPFIHPIYTPQSACQGLVFLIRDLYVCPASSFYGIWVELNHR
jgi:hypothetical protein